MRDFIRSLLRYVLGFALGAWVVLTLVAVAIGMGYVYEFMVGIIGSTLAVILTIAVAGGLCGLMLAAQKETW